jgi:hypothetical protein
MSQSKLPPSHRSSRPVSRRAVLGGAATGLLGAYVVGGSTFPASALTAMPARPAESLPHHFGVVAHFNFQKDIYGDERAVVAKIKALGARHVRSRLVPRLPGVRRGFTELADAGIHINGTCQVFGLAHQPSAAELMQEVRDFYGGEAGGVFSSFEGVNEPNNNGGAWVQETRARTQALWNAAKSSTKTDGIPIIGPSLADTWTLKKQYQQLGDLSHIVDRGSIHMYPRGTSPSTLIDAHVRLARASYGNHRFICTEGGYNNLMSHTRLQPVPEVVAGIYGPRHLLEHYIRGHRFFRYELLDDRDPGLNNWEAHFGLIAVKSNDASTWRDKPAFTAMKNFIDLIGDRGPSFTPSPLHASISGGRSDLRHVLLQKRNGVHYLILWRDTAVYDATRQKALSVKPDLIRVTLGRQARVSVYEPSTRATAVATPGLTNVCQVRLGGVVTVLEIRPA